MAFVLLPCDLPNWKLVSRFLTSLRDSKSSSHFIQTFTQLHNLCNVGINIGSFEAPPKDHFSAFETFLNSSDGHDFFANILPVMVDFALKIQELRPSQGFQYSLQLESKTFSLPRNFVASLLAHLFFCTLPRRSTNSHPTLTDPSFSYILSSLHRESELIKLKSFLNYFRLLGAHGAQGCVGFSRKVIDSGIHLSFSDWKSRSERLCKFVLKETSQIQDGLCDQAIIANYTPSFSSSILSGCQTSHEVESAMVYPEILVTAISAEHLLANEVYQVAGALRVSVIHNSTTSRSCVLLDELEFPEIVHSLISPDDDRQTESSNEINFETLLHELRKAVLGFNSVFERPGDDGSADLASDSEFISVSRQHSDAEDSGVQRDRNYSSDEDTKGKYAKNKRLRNFCKKGSKFQQTKLQNEKRKESLEKPLNHANESCSKKPDKREAKATSKERNSNQQFISGSRKQRGICREEGKQNKEDRNGNGEDPSTRNSHRKRKKRRNRRRHQKRRGQTDHKNSVEEGNAYRSNESKDKMGVSAECLNHPQRNNNGLYESRKAKLKQYSSSTKDSDYLTADLDQNNLDECITHKDERSDQVPSSLMDRVVQALHNIELEKKDKTKRKFKTGSENLESPSPPGKDSDPKRSLSPTVPTQRREANHKFKNKSQDNKVTTKPPLPKSAKERVPPAVPPTVRCGPRTARSNDGKVLAIHQPNFPDQTSLPATDEDSYFTATESFENHGNSESVKARKTLSKVKGRKGKESRRKKSFAQRLKETLARGNSVDSSAEAEKGDFMDEDEVDPSQDHVTFHSQYEETLQREWLGEGEDFEPLSGRLRGACRSESRLEPLSARFHPVTDDDDVESSNPVSLRLHRQGLWVQNRNVDDDEGRLERRSPMQSDSNTSDELIWDDVFGDDDDNNDENDSISSHYSFSSDYPSEFNEIYEKVEEILQCQSGPNELNPRAIAIDRFSKFELKRSLSDSYSGKALSLNGYLHKESAKNHSMSCLTMSRISDGISFQNAWTKKSSNHGQKEETSGDDWSSVIVGVKGCATSPLTLEMKALIQWAAASCVKKSHLYYYSLNTEHNKKLKKTVRNIEVLKWNVGDLVHSIFNSLHTNILEKGPSSPLSFGL